MGVFERVMNGRDGRVVRNANVASLDELARIF